jgi:Ser/Thr protein kinase RdoA (MazF antagonist)
MESSVFAALTQEEQIQRIEILGRKALQEFGIEALSITPLTHAENTTYRVSTAEGDFCLRVCRPGYQSDANVTSEIALVGAMRGAGLDVPRPYQDRVVKVSVAEVPEPRNCVLLGWQEGDFAEGALTAGQAEKVGEAMARMHDFAALWKVPAGFERQDLHAWADRKVAFESPSPVVEEEFRQLLLEVADESRALVRGLPRDPAHYGLIHGDLHRGNVLFEGEAVRIIDFDDAGWAYWLADFSAALTYEARFDNFAEVRDSMLAGYEKVRSLPPETERLLPFFIRMRCMTVCEWVAQRSDNPQLREEAPRWIQQLCEIVRKTRAAS